MNYLTLVKKFLNTSPALKTLKSGSEKSEKSEKRVVKKRWELKLDGFDHDKLQEQGISIIGNSLIIGRPILINFTRQNREAMS